jgi:hypothetical protein
MILLLPLIDSSISITYCYKESYEYAREKGEAHPDFFSGLDSFIGVGVGEEENIVIQGKNKREQYENSKILRTYRGIIRAIFLR